MSPGLTAFLETRLAHLPFAVGADQLLARADIFVIANPVLGGESSRWVLPTPPAFAPEEIAALPNSHTGRFLAPLLGITPGETARKATRKKSAA